MDQAISKAAKLALKGQKTDAEKIYREILARFPANQRALKGLQALSEPINDDRLQQELQSLIALYNQGRLREVIAQASAVLQRDPNVVAIHNILGVANARVGRFEEALASCDTALQLRPDDAEACHNRSLVLRQLRRFDEALASRDRALQLGPNNAESWNNRGLVLRDLKRFDEALASYDKALQIRLDYADACNNRGNVLRDMKRFDEALASYDKALQLGPDYAEAWSNRGNVLRDLKRFNEALASFDKALRLKSDYAAACNNRGIVLRDLKRFDEALASYDKALQLRPDHAEACHNRGNVLRDLKRFNEALTSYDKALQLRPDNTEAWNNRGLVLRELKRFDEALTSCDTALRLKPDYAEAFNNRGLVLRDLKRFDEALASYAKALHFQPDYAAALCHLLEQRARMCVWEETTHSASLPHLGIDGDAVPPFVMLTMDDDPARQLLRARAWLKAGDLPASAPLPKPAARSEKIRIGYFSADFHDHATMFLMARMLELHDSSRFEVHAFSYGEDRADRMRARVIGAVDQFHDVRACSDYAVAHLARGNAIDIAIDLKGYTQGGRTGIFACRAAPVQISFLGYPGSMGADFIDYIIADKVVLPQTSQRFYAEKVIYLPHTYQVNDNQRAISEKRFERAQLGLPESGFVFCCFNNNYKISAAEFDIWMRLLRAVGGSVLWLLTDNAWVAPNLRGEAEARGVDPDRLVFAERVPHAEHLARHRCADLFLDTFDCNAHTTASDALWAGLPVVTKLGNSFVARVAGSLLHAIDMHELTTDTVDAYEQLALDLATHPDRLAAARTKLAANRLITPLFDTEQFTRDIERAYELAFQRCVDGRPPDHLEVD